MLSIDINFIILQSILNNKLENENNVYNTVANVFMHFKCGKQGIKKGG
jgi:predicted rRNA methylase YqxC with S4 and FtsJ domains